MLKHTPTRTVVAACALWLACSTRVQPGGYELTQQGADASGAADAATARSDSPAAAHYNPAALVDGAGLRLAASATTAFAQLNARSTSQAPDAPWSSNTEAQPSVVPSLYASYARNDWMSALALNVPYGSKVRWPDDWLQRFDAVESSLQVPRIAPSFGYRFGPVRIAGGVHLNLGSFETERATPPVNRYS